MSPPVSKRQNNHLAPSCRLSLKKLLRTAWPRSERGHHSAVHGLLMNFRDLSWWPPLFSPHKMAKKITDYRDTPALHVPVYKSKKRREAYENLPANSIRKMPDRRRRAAARQTCCPSLIRAGSKSLPKVSWFSADPCPKLQLATKKSPPFDPKHQGGRQ